MKKENATKAHGEMDEYLQSFLTSALDGVSGGLHVPTALSPEKWPPIPLRRRTVRQFAPRGEEEKVKHLVGIEPRIVQPVASHNSGRVVPVTRDVKQR